MKTISLATSLALVALATIGGAQSAPPQPPPGASAAMGMNEQIVMASIRDEEAV